MTKALLRPFYLSAIPAISCLGIIIYSNSFYCPFHFDDILYITDNPLIRNVHYLLNNWTFYPCRLITFLSLTMNYHFSGLHVLGYHLFNIGIHLLSALFVWWLLLLTFSTPAMKKDKITQHADLIALLAGLVFVSHPIQTESVTYVWQRTSSLSALFYLASLCFYVKSRLLCHSGHLKLWLYYYFSSLMMALLAMFTKENSITLPLMIVLFELSFLKTKKKLDWVYLLPFLLTLLIIPLTILLTSAKFLKMQGFIEQRGLLTPQQYLLTQFRVMLTYIRLLFLPLNQNIDYDYPISRSFLEGPTLVSFLFLSGILYWSQRMFARYRLLAFSIFFFFLSLLPESSLLPLNDVIYEHRLYLPLAGYSLFLVSGLYYGTSLLSKSERPFTSLRVTIFVLTMIITFNSVLTYQRNKVWTDDLTLWDDATRKSPHKARPVNNRGFDYFLQRNFPQAIADFNKAISIDPTYAKAYSNRGNIYKALNRPPQAIADYNKAIELDPLDIKTYVNRGNIYDQQNNMRQAISDYTQAIEKTPDQAFPYYLRGNAYAREGLLNEAIADYTTAVELHPDSAVTFNNRGNAYVRQAHLSQALADYSKAIDIDPNYLEAYVNRGNTYSQLENFTQALLDFNKAIKLNPRYPQAYSNRAIVHYMLREYGKAWQDVRQAEGLGGAVNPNFIRALINKSAIIKNLP